MSNGRRIAAVILAGGKGERLGGVNKALLEIAGRRLVDYAIDAVAGCDPILVAVGKTPFEVPVGTRAVLDLPTRDGGPLAGVAAAAEGLDGQADLILSLAVDSPCFPRDFLDRALAALGDAPALIAAYGGQDYPTNALWRLSAVQSIPAQIHSLKRLAAGLGALRLDYAQWAAEDPFLNANTAADLALLEERLKRGSGA